MSRAAYHGGHVTKVTMDDMPVPQGDWKEHHSRQNAKYNAVLLTGVAALVGTLALVIISKWIFLFLFMILIWKP